MQIPFVKCQSVGNDFILVDQEDLRQDNENLVNLLPDLARVLCQRRFGPGADGLLVIERLAEGPILKTFNADGTSDFCMNGLQCLALHLHQQKIISFESVIEQLGRKVPVRIWEDGFVESLVPSASFRPEDVPLREDLPELFMTPISILGCELVVSALTTGTTHVVIFEDLLPEEERFFKLSKLLEHHSYFPDRASIIWATQQSEREIRVRIWERGVGETLGCGTGSVATAAVWSRWKNIRGDLEILSPGGSTFVRIDQWDQPVSVRTRPQKVFTGQFDFDLKTVASPEV